MERQTLDGSGPARGQLSETPDGQVRSMAIGVGQQDITGMDGADSGAELAVILCPLVSTHVPSCPLMSMLEWR